MIDIAPELSVLYNLYSIRSIAHSHESVKAIAFAEFPHSFTGYDAVGKFHAGERKHNGTLFQHQRTKMFSLLCWSWNRRPWRIQSFAQAKYGTNMKLEQISHTQKYNGL